MGDRGLTFLRLALANQDRDSIAWYRQLSSAQESLTRALQLDPELPEIHGDLGRLYHLAGDRDAAVREFRLESTLHPDSAEAWNNLGTALGEAKDYDEAIASYEKALALDLQCTSCLLNLESAIRSQDSRVAALARYKGQVAQSPGSPLAHLLYGMVLTADYQDDAAITELDTSLRSVPDLAAAHFYLGNLERHRGKRADAEAQYRKAVALEPRRGEFYEGLATILLEQNRDQEAGEALQKALALEPNTPSLHYKLAQIFQRSGRIAQAAYEREITDRLERADQEQAQLALDVSLGIGSLRSGKPADAAYHLRAALALAPNHPETNFYLGIALSQTGDTAESFRAFIKALVGRPDSAEFHYNYGIALWQASRAEAAIEQFRRTLQVAPDHPMAHCALGMALVSRGDLQEGQTEIARAQQLGACAEHVPMP
ncbi:MAG TPA: tetratricopeptide repeat protein [Acidobacteriaceae bacterium]|nr:tetratricopeptide repeat protein [Acidobacteriaceae bacterium]